MFLLQDHDIIKFNESDKKALSKHFAELKTEMSIDTKQLSEHNRIKALLATKTMLENKIQQTQEENRSIEHVLQEERKELETIRGDVENLKDEIARLDSMELKANDEK